MHLAKRTYLNLLRSFTQKVSCSLSEQVSKDEKEQTYVVVQEKEGKTQDFEKFHMGISFNNIISR